MSLPAAIAAIGEVNDLVPNAEVVARVAVAALLGAVIGFEREVADQPAGLRTHLTVALGAAVFGTVSTLGFTEFVTDRETNLGVDVTRVASQVVVGIGFLGAGMIFRAGSTVRNLTTAASLWVTSAIGLAAGVGDIGLAALGTAVLLAALLALRIPRDLIRHRITRKVVHTSIRVDPDSDAHEVLDAVRALDGIEVTRVSWSKRDADVVLDLTLEGAPDVRPETRLEAIVLRPDVVAVDNDTAVSSTADDGNE